MDIDLSIPLHQSLMPDSSNEDTQSEEPSTPKLSKTNQEENDALVIVTQDSLIEESFIPSLWCQRCGTLETPRWRYGPAGSSTLCNACHLKWAKRGKPLEGYSSNVFPPTHQIPISLRKKRKSNTKKQDPSKKLKLSTPDTVLCDKNQKSMLKKEKEKAPLKEQQPVSIDKRHCCAQCQTKDTPLWRKGPSGPKTLCNACGLRWSKSEDAPTSLKKPKTSSVGGLATKSPSFKKKFQHILLFNRKKFIKHGLYFDASRLSTHASFSFDLPIHQGEFLISKEKEFELPPYIHQERELGVIKGVSATRIPFFVRIRSNLYVERKPQSGQRDPLVCLCSRPPPDQMGCGDDCINRMMFYECDPKHCPCGDQCSNQRFQRKERKKALQVYLTEQRGWGLRTLTDIKKGDFVIEYRGEIISQKLCEERMCTDYVNEKNFYFLDYHNGEVIDATAKGTEARFINHSCEPNCHIEKWSCRGESNFGVFASKDISANSELFYDYNFSTFNGSVESHQQCHCASKNCRGLIGRKRKM